MAPRRTPVSQWTVNEVVAYIKRLFGDDIAMRFQGMCFKSIAYLPLLDVVQFATV